MLDRLPRSVILTLALAAVVAPAASARPLNETASLRAADSSVAEAKAFIVTSTLAGKKVLAHRIRWIGRPNLPAAQVSIVEFVIDGKVRWDEGTPPYTYGDDRNWLVTSWLTPGRHSFVVPD